MVCLSSFPWNSFSLPYYARKCTYALFLCFFFLNILLYFTNKKTAYIFITLIFITFPLWWFSRFSLTENVMLASLWIALLFLLHFIQKPSSNNLFFLFLSLGLLSITRIEGMFLLFLLLSHFYFFLWQNNFFEKKYWFDFFYLLSYSFSFSSLLFYTIFPSTQR